MTTIFSNYTSLIRESQISKLRLHALCHLILICAVHMFAYGAKGGCSFSLSLTNKYEGTRTHWVEVKIFHTCSILIKSKLLWCLTVILAEKPRELPRSGAGDG